MRARLGPFQSLCVLAAALIAIWAAATPIFGTSAAANGAALTDAIEQFRAGDLRGAVHSADEILAREPGATRATALKACALWELGYQDHAVTTWQLAIAWGRPPEQPLVAGCFAERLREHGLRVLEIGQGPVIYPAPAHRYTRAAENVAFIAAREGRAGDAIIALSCVDVGEELRILAGLHFGVGAPRGEPRETPRAVRTCLRSRFEPVMRARRLPDGTVLFYPRDRAERLFNPASSRLRPAFPRPLP